jgi:hypothetical protein
MRAREIETRARFDGALNVISTQPGRLGARRHDGRDAL